VPRGFAAFAWQAQEAAAIEQANRLTKRRTNESCAQVAVSVGQQIVGQKPCGLKPDS